MQAAIPQYIAESSRNLYRECLRRAEYLGNKHGNRDKLVARIRWEFRKNMNETDPVKIQQHKDAAVRGLFNYMMYEAHSILTGKQDDAD